MNIGGGRVHVSFQITVFIFSGYVTRSEIAESYGSSILQFSIVAAPVYIPTSSVGGFPFLHTLSSIYYL